MILNTLGHVADYEQARDLVNRLMAGLPSGSYLVISDSTATSEGMIAASNAYNSSGAVPYYVREVEEIAGFFDGLGAGGARSRTGPGVAARGRGAGRARREGRGRLLRSGAQGVRRSVSG
ncbi:hypothetical protein SHIRM173S_06276 [Streptomyces hirsutus]